MTHTITYSIEHKWNGAHRARGEAECSMKLHPTSALEHILPWSNSLLLSSILNYMVTMVICSKVG